MTGLETILIGGGAQWLIGRLADEVGGEALSKLKTKLTGEPNLAEARQAIREYEEATGVKVTFDESGNLSVESQGDRQPN